MSETDTESVEYEFGTRTCTNCSNEEPLTIDPRRDDAFGLEYLIENGIQYGKGGCPECGHDHENFELNDDARGEIQKGCAEAMEILDPLFALTEAVDDDVLDEEFFQAFEQLDLVKNRYSVPERAE